MTVPIGIRTISRDGRKALGTADRHRLLWAIHDEVRTALAPFAHQPVTRETLQVMRAKVNDILIVRAAEADLTHWYVDISAVGDVHSRPDLNVDLQAPRYKGPRNDDAPTSKDTFLGWHEHFDLWRVLLRSGQGVFLAWGPDEALGPSDNMMGRVFATEIAARRYRDLPESLKG